MLIHISSYGGSSKNGAHCMAVQYGNLHVYFSYRAPVAFRYPDFGLVISENTFGKVTDGHINTIKSMGRHERVDRSKFMDMLTSAEQRNTVKLARNFLTSRMKNNGNNFTVQEECHHGDDTIVIPANDQQPDLKQGDPGQTEHQSMDGKSQR